MPFSPALRPAAVAIAWMSILAPACVTPGPTGGLQSDARAEIPGGQGGVGFDDVWFSPTLGRVLLASGSRGLAVIDPATGAPAMVAGPSESYSVTESNGLLFAIDRAQSKLLVFDPSTRTQVGSGNLSGFADYVRAAPNGDLLISQPFDNRVEVLHPAASGAPNPEHVAYIPTGSGAEGLAINPARRQAYTHLSDGSLAVISLDTNAVVSRFRTGCGSHHGIPVYDDARGIVFAGCSSAKVVALSLDDGRVLGSHSAPGGSTILGYSPWLHHFYLRADPGVPVYVLAVAADGTFTQLGTADAATNGHCLTADDRGQFWVCDANTGALLRFTDPFPASP